jgi:hypothetical protein
MPVYAHVVTVVGSTTATRMNLCNESAFSAVPVRVADRSAAVPLRKWLRNWFEGTSV